MIQLSEDCLVFHTSEGENIPYSAEMISVEIMGDSASFFDADFIKHAAAAVLHYYRDELGRETVTVAEFSLALERILHGFNLATTEAKTENPSHRIARSDLARLASEASSAGELLFFTRLRDELRAQLSQTPETLCFQGLRDCVKQLAGVSRWTNRCQSLQDQIVDYLRSCLWQERGGIHCSLVVK